MLEESYNSYEEIPDGFRHLYRQADGKWHLIGQSEIRTIDDVERVQEGLRKEREDHKQSKERLSAFRGLDPAEVRTKLDNYDELELAAKAGMDEEKIQSLADAKIKAQLAPVQRELQTTKDELGHAKQQLGSYEELERKRKVQDAVRKACIQSKVRESAITDILMISTNVFEDMDGRIIVKDGAGATPGIDPTVWLSEMKPSRPHWWPDSQGGGAQGGKGGHNYANNPWTYENWNMTEQGKIVQADRNRAEQLAKSAGTVIGGKKPAKRS